MRLPASTMSIGRGSISGNSANRGQGISQALPAPQSAMEDIVLTRSSTHRLVLAAALACVGCAPQTSDSQTQGAENLDQTFKSADTDGSGTLSQQEVIRHFDTDSDGELSSDEWSTLVDL